MKGEIRWDRDPGLNWARCSCTNPPRILGDSEFDVILHPYPKGTLRTTGKAQCKQCEAKMKWDKSY